MGEVRSRADDASLFPSALLLRAPLDSARWMTSPSEKLLERIPGAARTIDSSAAAESQGNSLGRLADVESDSVAHLIQGLRNIPETNEIAARRAAAPELDYERAAGRGVVAPAIREPAQMEDTGYVVEISIVADEEESSITAARRRVRITPIGNGMLHGCSYAVE